MKRIVLIGFIFIGLLGFFNLANARSGCCSHHGGVCGCSCCDGTSLSATCAPYYPSCGSTESVAPVERSFSTSVNEAPQVQAESINIPLAAEVVQDIAETKENDLVPIETIKNDQIEQLPANNIDTEKQTNTKVDNKNNTTEQNSDDSDNVVVWLFLIIVSGVIGYKINNKKYKD